MELDQRLIKKTTPEALQSHLVYFKKYRFTILTPTLIRIEKGNFNDFATLMVFNRRSEEVPFKTTENGDIITIETEEVILTYNTSLSLESNYVIFKKDRKGERRLLNNDFNLKGTMRTLDTFYDGGFCVAKDITDFKIKTLPLSLGVMSKNGVAVIDDHLNPILKADGKLYERVDEEIDSYLFLHLNDYLGALKDFYLISEYPPLVPRFALGNWWSRYHAYHEDEYLALLDRFEAEDVPLSVATIDMDWHYVDIESDFHLSASHKTDENFYGNLGGWTGNSWNKKLWPHYKEVLKEIHNRGYKITLNLHPKDGVRWFEDQYEEMAKAMGLDPKTGHVIPFDFTDPSYINAYFKTIIHPHEDEGVDFWWIDYQQERETRIKNLDPLWPLNHYHFLDSKEHLILSRYAELGSHRYPLGFSGDTKQIFEFLAFMPYFTFTASNAGYTWWSHDIGAHHYGIKDDDLYTRWIEFGVFSPINRIHANCMDVVSKEPWLNKTSVHLITNYFLRLRHRLIPYLYQYSHLTKEEEIPLIRPLYYEEPDNELAYKEESTYFFGDLVISPIVTKTKNGYAIKKFYLPKGRYYDYQTGRWYLGGKMIEVARDLGEIPILIKEGKILPLQNDLKNTDGEAKSLEVNLVSRTANLELRETVDQPFNTYFVSEETKEGVTLNVYTSTDKSVVRDYEFNFRYIVDAEAEVLVNGKPYPFTSRHPYNLLIKVEGINVRDKVKIVLTNIHVASFKEYLDQYSLFILTGENMVNQEKQVIYEAIRDHVKTKEDLKAYLKTLKCEKNLKVRLKELTYFD